MEEKEFKEILNLHFTPSRPAINNYVDRRDENTRFLDALNEPGFQTIVYGATGVGKTSLVL